MGKRLNDRVGDSLRLNGKSIICSEGPLRLGACQPQKEQPPKEKASFFEKAKTGIYKFFTDPQTRSDYFRVARDYLKNLDL